MADKSIEELQKEISIRIEQEKALADDIANLVKQVGEGASAIQKRFSEADTQLGGMDRLFKVLNAAQTADAIYEFNKQTAASGGKVLDLTPLKKQIQNSIENLASGVSGYDMTGTLNKNPRKTYKDIVIDQMGMKNRTAATVFGAVGDISTDLGNVGAIGPLFKVVGSLGKTAIDVGQKIPTIEKGIDAVGRMFNLFYDVEKAGARFPNGATITDLFKNAIRDGVKTGKWSGVEKFGKDTSTMSADQVQRLWMDHGYQLAPAQKGISETTIFNERFSKVIDRVLNSDKTSFPGSQILEKGSAWTKGLMAVNPLWSTSIGVDTQMINLTELGFKTWFQRMVESYRLMKDKGRSGFGPNGPDLYKAFQDESIIGTIGPAPGIGPRLLKRPVDWYNTTIQNFARVPLALDKVAKGGTTREAAQYAESLQINYDKRLFPKLISDLELFVPFLHHHIQNMRRWGELVPRNAEKLSVLGEFRTGMESDELNRSQIKPRYAGEMTLGRNGFGLGGSSVNQSFNMTPVFGDLKAKLQQLNIALRVPTELISNYSIVKERSISGDTRANAAWQNLGMGKNADTNGYIKYFAETIGGSMMSSALKLADPKKTWLESVGTAFSPAKEYDLGPNALSRQYVMNQREQDKGWLIESFKEAVKLIAQNYTPVAYAGTNTSAPDKFLGLGEYGFDAAKSLSKAFGGSSWNRTNEEIVADSKKLPRGTGPKDIDTYNAFVDKEYTQFEATIRQHANTMTDLNKAAAYYQTEMLKLVEWYRYNNRMSDDLVKSKKAAIMSESVNMALKPVGTESGITVEMLKGNQRATSGTAAAQNFNKVQEALTNLMNHMLTLTKELSDKWTSYSIEAKGQHELEILKIFFERMGVSKNTPEGKELINRFNNLNQQVIDHQLGKLESKIGTINAETQKLWAESLPEGSERVKALGAASVSKFTSSEDASILKGNKQYTAYMNRIAAYNAETNRKITDQEAKEARTRAENVSKIYKDEMSFAMAEVKRLFDMGGMTIQSFINKQKEESLKTHGKGALSWIDAFAADIATSKTNITTIPASVSLKDNSKSISADEMDAIRRTLLRIGTENQDQTIIAREINKLNLPKDLEYDITPEQKRMTSSPDSTAITAKEELLKLRTNLKDSMDKGDLTTALKAMADVFKYMEKIIEQGLGNKENFYKAQKGFVGSKDELTKESEITEKQSYDLQRKLNDHYAKMKIENDKMLVDIYNSTGPRVLGIRSFSGAKTRYGMNVEPYAPAGYDARAESLKAKLAVHDDETTKWLTSANEMPGDFKLDLSKKPVSEKPHTTADEFSKRHELANPLETEKQANERAIKDIEDQIARYEAARVQLSEDGVRKLDALKEGLVVREKARNKIIALDEQETFKTRIQVAGDMASMLEKTAQSIYDSSGKKSKEMFYLMKAAALAEATITGYQTILNAYNSGNKINPYIGIAYAAIASAFVGTQIASIAKSTFNGPGKARGGKITDGAGGVDDVSIMAMKDEWVIQASSSRKYGDAFMNALNLGEIDIENMSLPSLPDYSNHTAHYEDGGKVAASNSQTVTGVELHLHNEGAPLQVTKTTQSVDGTTMVINAWIDGYTRNVSRIQERFPLGR
ncbi:MAG: hypothetical protein CSYNP_01585 [Syntrophus sp. SKADARSKE-3]|nr:hypothetical protein [Syntrophus sp. SKADARSKE-3]